MDYSPEVLRRFSSPRRTDVLAERLPGVVEGEAEDRALNVWVRFQIQTREGRLHRVRFKAFGCPYTIAAASWVAERLEGHDAGALAGLDVDEIVEALGMPVERIGKLLRIEDALRECHRALQREAEAKGL